MAFVLLSRIIARDRSGGHSGTGGQFAAPLGGHPNAHADASPDVHAYPHMDANAAADVHAHTFTDAHALPRRDDHCYTYRNTSVDSHTIADTYIYPHTYFNTRS